MLRYKNIKWAVRVCYPAKANTVTLTGSHATKHEHLPLAKAALPATKRPSRGFSRSRKSYYTIWNQLVNHKQRAWKLILLDSGKRRFLWIKTVKQVVWTLPCSPVQSGTTSPCTTEHTLGWLNRQRHITTKSAFPNVNVPFLMKEKTVECFRLNLKNNPEWSNNFAKNGISVWWNADYNLTAAIQKTCCSRYFSQVTKYIHNISS